MACSKEKEVILNMIDVYRDMPYLWQKSHKDYLNQSLREEGFRVLLEVYKNFDEKASAKTIKKKFMNMRTNYNKELVKVNSSKQTGAGRDDVYVPTLWYFDALNFIGSRSEPCRITPESIEDEEGSHSSDEDISSQQSRPSASISQQTEPIPSTSRGQTMKKKKETLLQKQEKILKSAEVMLSNKEEEDWEVFGKFVGLQLKDINRTQLVFTQKIISDVIYNAKLGRLSEDSCLLVAPSEVRPTVDRYNYQMPFIQSPPSSYSYPSPYNRQSPELPLKRPSSRNHPSPTQSRRPSSTTQYHSSPYYSQSPRHQSQLVQSPQHSIQFPQEAVQSSQQAIQSPQLIIQFPQEAVQSSQQASQSPQHTILFPQQVVQRSQQASQSPQHTIQFPQQAVQRSQQTSQSPQQIQFPQQVVQRSEQASQSPQHTIQFSQQVVQRSEQASQSPQHTIQIPQQAVQSSQQAIQSQQHTIQLPQHTIQSPQHSFPSIISVNNPEDFLEYIDNDSGSNNYFSPSVVEGSANIMKDFLIFKKNKE